MDAKSIITRGYEKYTGLDTWWKQTQFKANSPAFGRKSEVRSSKSETKGIGAKWQLRRYIWKGTFEKTNPIYRRAKLAQPLFWKEIMAKYRLAESKKTKPNKANGWGQGLLCPSASWSTRRGLWQSNPWLTFNTYARTFEMAEQKAMNLLPNLGDFVFATSLAKVCRKQEIPVDKHRRKTAGNR